MKINLWYCDSMEQWRWVLTGGEETKCMWQESGQRPHLRDAMNDVATTVEYLLNEKKMVK